MVDKIPSSNTKVAVPDQEVSAGGPATNAAGTFAFLGGRSALITAVGKHPLGSIIRQDLAPYSVLLHDMASRRNQAPPVSSILVVRGSGERTVVSANAVAFGTINAKPNPRWLCGISIVQVDGHYMAQCIAYARLARARAIPVVLDSGSWKEGIAELLPLVDVAICSDDFRPSGCRDEIDTLEFLVAHGIPRVAITRGAAPLMYKDQRNRGKIPVDRVRPIDTLGAGDILHGAYCYCACQQGQRFRDCLTFASRVATFSCLYRGTRLWMQAFPGLERIK